MCDTLVALPSKTESGNLILGKNSDREPLEAQAILHVERKKQKSETLECTFISIPQVEETFEVLLSKPFQMWGAEMGVNEYGVAIGNEAVFTNVNFRKNELGLTGMDLLRLALERSKNADTAAKLIIELLEKYGQNACGGYKNKNFYYHNSFLIADPKEAFILETAGKSWARKKVQGMASISNGLSIEEDYESASFKKEPKNIQAIFSGKKENFKAYFSDLIYTKAGKSSFRKSCTLGYLEKGKKVGIKEFMEALRQHEREDFNPKKASPASICMHATGFTNPSDTTGSMVAEIRTTRPSTIWLTGTPHPCMSLYIPYYLGSPFDQTALSPGANPDESLWWKARKIQEGILRDNSRHQKELRESWDEIQLSWIEKDQEFIRSNVSLGELKNFSAACLMEYLRILER